MNLPLIRSHEIIDHKRCPKKWYWKWRLGLVPRTEVFSALSLGTWVHAALAAWYSSPRNKRTTARLVWLFEEIALKAMAASRIQGAQEHALMEAEKLHNLGSAMLTAYGTYYGNDPTVEPIATEIPIEFEITDTRDNVLGIYKLKPDMVFRYGKDRRIWLMETKTAASIRTDHLPIDGQARPYSVLAERSLRRLGVIGKQDEVKGILYNFLRKAYPDERETNAEGFALNKDGSVSKRQQPPLFQRTPITLTRRSKIHALTRIQMDVAEITFKAQLIREGTLSPSTISKTDHYSCAKTCQFFKMCILEEEGGDITEMQRIMYLKKDPYKYDEESTEDLPSFEMG